jgi:hypothetical protein
VWLPVSPERAFRRHTAKSSRLPWISRALRAQMRPAAACRAPCFAGAASAVSTVSVNVSVNVSVMFMT